MTDWIDEKEFTFTSAYGKEITVKLSKFPSLHGREIIFKYPVSAILAGSIKFGDYESNAVVMKKLMSFVQVLKSDNTYETLKTDNLIQNHLPSWEDIVRVEFEMIKYNCSFFQNGEVSSILGVFSVIVQEWILKMWTNLLQVSSTQEK